MRLNRDEEALSCFDDVIARGEQVASACLNKGLLKLSLGDYRAGWHLYESRWKAPSFRSQVRSFDSPLWRGDADLSGKTILIHAEQGLGDTIQFARYLPMLAREKCRIVFEVQAALLSICREQGLEAEIVARGDPLPPFDVHCPLLSLPLAFGTTEETVPAYIPYLRADPQKVLAWRERLAPSSTRRIGLVWSGNPSFRYDAQRSIGLLPLLPDSHRRTSLVRAAEGFSPG